MSPLYFAHLLILLGFLSVPFLPLRLLQYAVFVPTLLALIWLLFDGCPISFAQPELNGESKFTLHVVRKLIPSVTENQVEHFLTFYLVLSTLIASIRLWKLKR